MSTPPAGWYPDPQSPTGQRYFDGTAWAQQPVAPAMGQLPPPQPPVAPAVGQLPPPQPPYTGSFAPAPRSGMSTGVKAALWSVGAVVGLGALLLVVKVAVVDKTELEELESAGGNCETYAKDAVAANDFFDWSMSEDGSEETHDAALLRIRETTLTTDYRPVKRLPTGGHQARVVTCQGTGVWDDDSEDTLTIWILVDADGDLAYEVEDLD